MTADEARRVWRQVEARWPEAPTIDERIVFDHLRDLPVIDVEAAINVIAGAGQGCPTLLGLRRLASRLRRERDLRSARERRRHHLDAIRAQLAAISTPMNRSSS